jgi:hypothetical protein
MCGDVQVTVLGGLTVDVDFTTYWEPGDCGYRGTYVDNWEIVGVNGKRKKNTDWILKRLTAADEERIAEACNGAIN